MNLKHWNLVLSKKTFYLRFKVDLSVCVCVRPSVCSLFEVLFKRLLPNFPEVQCQNFLDFWNPWGKVMKRSGLRFETFAHEGW